MLLPQGIFFTQQNTANNKSLSNLSILNTSVGHLFDKPGIMVVQAREYPWSALGRLNINGRQFCNAVAVDSDKILTLASCLYNKNEGKWFDNSVMTYVGAYQRDNADLNAKVSGFEAAKNYDPKNKTLAAISQDWALVTLVSPIGIKTGWLGISEQEKDHQTLTAGYRRGWEHALAVYPFCSLGANSKNCPNASVDGVLNQFVLSESQLMFSPPAGIDVIQDNWTLSSVGQAPAKMPIMPVPLDTISRLMKEQGYLGNVALSTESLKQALEKAEQEGVVTQTDSIGMETLYQLIKSIKAKNTDTASTS